MSDDRILLSLTEVSVMLGLSNKKVRQMALDAKLRSVRIDGKIMVYRAAVDEYLKSVEIKPAE